MPRKPDAAVAERNCEIAERVQKGEAVSDLAAEYGLDESTIYHVLKEKNIKAVRSKASERVRPLSQLHVKLGATISAIRIFQRRMDLEPFARAVGLSSTKISRLEKGIYSPTLAELEKIAAYCEVPVGDLIVRSTEIQQKVASCRAA